MITQTFLEDVRKKLLAEKQRLEEQLASVAKPSLDGDYTATWEQYGDTEEDNAAEVADYSNSIGVGYALEQELNEVIDALQRMNEDTYGVCASCKESIDEKRLEVRPQSRYCMGCQGRMGS